MLGDDVDHMQPTGAAIFDVIDRVRPMGAAILHDTGWERPAGAAVLDLFRSLQLLPGLDDGIDHPGPGKASQS